MIRCSQYVSNIDTSRTTRLHTDETYRNHFLKVFHGNFLPFDNVGEGELDAQIVAATRYLETDNRNAGHALTIGQSINPDGTWTNRKGEIELERLRTLVGQRE